MVSDKRPEADDLDLFFDAAKGDRVPSDDLVARVLAGAAEIQSAATTVAAPTPRRATGLFELLGGWIPVSGLAAAGLAGLAIGVTLPQTFGTDGTLSAIWPVQEAVGFTSFDAISFATEEGAGP